MKKQFSIFILITLFKIAFATYGNYNFIATSSAQNTTTDTVPYVIEEDDMEDLSDSLITFPSSDLYCDWDTS
ncbi:MAG: hypothetical protein JNL69_06385, partial [Bacteroidia bacterium]|nr:hypothetical protein [Bacteroidia bacterium]